MRLYFLNLLISSLIFQNVFAMSEKCEALSFSNYNGTAVEMEFALTPDVMSIITTETGKVSDIFEGTSISLSELPQSFSNWLTNSNLTFEHALWDVLPFYLKIELLKWRNKNLYAQRLFSENRKIKGLKIRPKILLSFDKQTEFLGQQYADGEHDIDTSSFFLPYVEYQNISSVNNLNGVELHLRSSNYDAKTLIEAARSIAKSLQVKSPNFHQHLVADLPDSVFQGSKNSFNIALNITEFFRRANLLAEFVSISELNSIQENRDQAALAFGYVNDVDISYLIRYLTFGNSKDHGFLKTCWVGFRGPDFYDSNKKVFGFEYRAIGRGSMVHSKIAAQIHSAMITKDFGFDSQLMTEWLNRNQIYPQLNIENLTDATDMIGHKLIYRPGRIYPIVLAEYLESEFSNDTEKIDYFLEKVKGIYGGNTGIAILIHDWRQDPLFADDPDGLNFLIKQQKMAMNRFNNTNDNEKLIIRDFVWQSGLLNKLAQTFKLNLADLQPLLDNKESTAPFWRKFFKR